MGAFLFLKLFFALALTIGFANVRMLTNFVSSASDNESFNVNGSFFVFKIIFCPGLDDWLCQCQDADKLCFVSIGQRKLPCEWELFCFREISEGFIKKAPQ